MILTHYGWRNEFFSIFPNAVGVRPIDAPDIRLIPWLNIIILVIFAALALGFYRMTQWFRRTKIDPLLEDAGERLEAVDQRTDAARDQIHGIWSRFRAWLDTWKAKPPR